MIRWRDGAHAPAETFHQVAPWYNIHSPSGQHTRIAGVSRVFLHKNRTSFSQS